MIIAVGEKRYSELWRNTKISWPELAERLKTTTRTPESQGQYANMSKKQQDEVKDIGGFVGGKLRGGKRKAETVESREVLTLDADYAGTDFVEVVEAVLECAWCIYSTHKHTPESPRLRLVVPLSRPVSAEEYEALARQVAFSVGIDRFDDTTYQPHRLMYWPSTSLDGEYLFREASGAGLNVEDILARYADWRDVSSWPVSSRTMKKRQRLHTKQEDPTAKKGLVGAFCRTYSVEEAMEKFIPGVYTPCSTDGRYTYSPGSTTGGAVLYDNGLFLYSNHATDPAGGELCNAFDLVRIHRFGELDEEAAPGTPVAKSPSYKAMLELVGEDAAVKLRLHQERLQDAAADFAHLKPQEEPVDNSWIEGLATDAKGNICGTIDNVKKILTFDERLRKRIRYNSFIRKPQGEDLPWESEEQLHDWSDTDDAGLRHYLERMWRVKGRGNITDAWALVAQENAFHPVREYLERLCWDGKPRLDTVLIRYLGAADSEYVRAVTGKALISAVARVLQPGIKVDTMLVIVGPQGCGKSELVKRLGGTWWSDTLTTFQGKDAYEQLQGVWILEIAELAAMKKADIETIKHFISKAEDSYRPAYGKHIQRFPRQCIFIGTTNTHEFLRDVTGNRRFYPVDVEVQPPTESLWTSLTQEEADQLWAEARQRWLKGEDLYLDERQKAMAEAVQQEHLEKDPRVDMIKEFLDTPLPEDWANYGLSERRMYLSGGGGMPFSETPAMRLKERDRVCVLEIWCECLGRNREDITRRDSREICDCVRQIGGWEFQPIKVQTSKMYPRGHGFVRSRICRLE